MPWGGFRLATIKLYDYRMRRLITAHLELVSSKAISDHRDELKSLLKGHPGVYALYRRDRLRYVGQAKNLFGRLDAHLRDRHAGTWDRFSAYVTARHDLVHEVEALAIRMAYPDANRRLGRFGGSSNLVPELKRLLTEKHLAGLDGLSGRQSARRLSRRAEGIGADALAGMVRRRRQLRGWIGDEEFKAMLHPDGIIVVGGEPYASPFAAAVAATGRRRNGWRFWHLKGSDLEWRPLIQLRR